MQQQWLPLFPLQVVLLPEAELPLHIFEDRYREMISEVRRDNTGFGVILANDKGILSTGCTASIKKVLRDYPDGRMDILAVGRRRFEIQRVNEDRSFLRGEVEFFDDDDAAPAQHESIRQAVEAYNELRALDSDRPLPDAELSHPQLSFKLAQPIADLSLRQTLLVARSEADRIRQLAAFLPGYLSLQKKIQHVKRVAPRNGHGGASSHIH